ncbi:MAG: alkaline phosphatase [Bacteroidetes bacterium]|nr:alkaline phosphatase [Bacteroidota bacterium]
MKRLIKIYLFALLPISVFVSCNTMDSEADTKEGNYSDKQVNVILLIGDGMGLSQVSSVYYFGDQPPSFSRFNEISLINVSPVKLKITDSASGATAFACGEKTYNGAIGVDADTNEIPNIFEILSVKGYKTGIISTSSVTHATPACFYAHVEKRSMQYEIAEQIVDSDVDFFAGGGEGWFRNRKDGRDLYPELIHNGFTMDEPLENLTLSPEKKYGFLLAKKAMPTMLEDRGAFLSNYTNLALDYFTQSKSNFFLMIEGSQIDWAGHDNNSEYLIEEMKDFDETINVALDYAEQYGNTLVIVTADHETGGFTLSTNDGDYGDIKPSFSNGGHSATLIPVFATGNGAENFKGVYENTDIFHKIIDVVSN